MTRILAWACAAVLALGCYAAIPASSVLPAGSWVEEGIDDAAVRRMLTAHPSDPVEGIWTATADGASIAVIPGTPPGAPRHVGTLSFLLVILRSPRAGIVPGTVMGWCAPAAKKGYYDSRIFTRCDGRGLSSPKRFTLHLTDNSRLAMTRVHEGVELVPWRILPYMFRSMLRERHDRAPELDGMLRVWPLGDGEPLKPRYL